MVLTIANSQTDQYYSFVFDLLRQRDEEPVLFCADKCLEGEIISLSVRNGKHYHYAVINGKELDLSKVKAIWYLKPHLPKQLRVYNPPEHREFIRRQFLATWQSLYDILGDKKWVSPHWNVVKAESKMYQLTLACHIGFELPETLVSSEPEKIREFWEHCEGDMITKALSISPIEDHVIFTNKVTERHMGMINSAKNAPSIFQKNITKKYELRIIVVGNKVFTVKIGSQEGETTKIDWRKSNQTGEKIPMEKYGLPSTIKNKCLDFVSKLGLKFGCIDMIVTPDDRYVFLEINPNGQWYFVQTSTGMPIGEAIADLLC